MNEDVLFSPEEAMLYALNEEYVVDDVTHDEGGTEEESSEKETKKREPGKRERILSNKTYPDKVLEPIRVFFFFPKPLFFRTLGKFFAQIVFFFYTFFFFPFFFYNFIVKYPLTLQKLCFTI